MQSFLVLVICSHLLFVDDGKVKYIWFLHGDSDEHEGDNYSINDFLGMTTQRIRFLESDIKTEMMLLPWNNFPRSFFRFVVVKSDHDEGPVKIHLPFKPITFFL